MSTPIVTLLTDFGISDHYVAAMKGVILSRCPGATLVDITHQIAPFRIAEAAFTLAQAWQCFPAGTIHLVVVDPGVGSNRRAILAEVAGHYFIAPDNGVLTPVLDVEVPKVRVVSAPAFVRPSASSTFHGRDIFAPAAGFLAAGGNSSGVGPHITDPVRLPDTRPSKVNHDRWEAGVLSIDQFGNIITAFGWDTFPWVREHPFQVTVAGRELCNFFPSYAWANPGELFVCRSSSNFLEIAIREGNAAAQLGATHSTRVELRRL